MPPEPGIEGRLASIETEMRLMNQTWKEHTREQDEFYKDLDIKVDKILLEQARDEGERRAIKRLAGYVSLVVSVTIGVVTFVINYLSNG